MQTILNNYYANNAQKLHVVVNKILLSFGNIENKDKDDFYSLANEVFIDVMKRYDGVQSFDGFLYSCLDRKIKTEITRRNRQKRTCDRQAISWETPLDDEGTATIGDLIKDTRATNQYDIDKTFFEDDGDKYSEKMLNYISRLSSVQKEIVKLIIAGYTANEIKKILNINGKIFNDAMAGIRSYRNVSLLF